MGSGLNNMSDEFFDWLNECPVQWVLNKEENDFLEYLFICPDKEETEED